MAEKTQRIGDGAGPYDITELQTPAADLANSHLDLGAVLVPVVEGGQVTVEMSADHQPEAVYLVTPVGRIGVHAFAAPRTGGMWREVVKELAESLRGEGARTSIIDGHWGREVIAEVPGGAHRFIGVDGPRWMLRCVASGPEGDVEQLAQLARAVLAETVVRRGNDPFPPRDLLPIVLPPVLAEQVVAAQEQMAADQGDAPLGAATGVDEVVPGGAVEQAASATFFTDEPEPEPEPVPEVVAEPASAEPIVEPEEAVELERSQGSAMQRLRGRRRRRD